MKLRVRSEAICIRDGKVLCERSKGYTCFPGGGVDAHEAPVTAAKRECMEESDRALTNCTVAHPPTVQMWAPGYAKKSKWAEGYDGGLTYWIQGSASAKPVHAEAERHKDFVKEFTWVPVDDVIEFLKSELTGDWAEDVKVRLAIVETYQKMHAPIKEALRAPVRLSQATPFVSSNP